MKKSTCLFLGLSLLGACSIGVLSSAKNESKVASADTFLGYATDVFDVNAVKSAGTSAPSSFNLSGSDSSASYRTTAKRLLTSGLNNAVNNEKKSCFVYDYGRIDGTQTYDYGFYVTQTVGYVRSIEIEYGDYELIGGTPGELCVFGQQTPYYGTYDMYYKEFRGEDIGVITYSSNKLEIENKNYKYIGFGTKEGTGPSSIKKITIYWELYDFSENEDNISWDIDEEDGVDMEYGDTHQVVVETSGEGAATDGKVVWEAANPLIATVDDEGLITATGGGHTTITATYGDVYIEGDVWVDEYVNPVIKVISQIGETETIKRLNGTSELHAGDIIAFVCEEYDKALGDVESDDEYCVAINCDADRATGIVSEFGEGVQYFIVNGDSENGFTFTSLDGQTLSYENDDYHEGVAANYPKCLWDVTIGSTGTAIVRNKAKKDLVFNYVPSHDSFELVISGQPISIYKVDLTTETPYEVSDLIGYDSPALSFAHDFLNKISAICVSSGETDLQALSDVWDSVFDESNGSFKALNAISMLMFENAEANANGDTIQKAVALYDFILGKYSLEDHLNRGVSSASRVVTKNASGTMIVVVTSILISGTIALAIIGAYRFRKKDDKDK